ncbi:MAG: hypothetical protein ACRC8Y_25720 [Chroococcales cyanobacterium]
MSLVIGVDGEVCSNDFSRYRVTWRQPSNAPFEAKHPVPKQALNPLMVSVMASAMTLLATTEVVTTNMNPINK